MAPLLRQWVATLEAALAPMRRRMFVGQALTKMQALMPRRNDDKTALRLWLQGMLHHLAGYPEGPVLEALNEAERTLKFRPAPAEVIKIIDRDLAGPKDELARMKHLLALADRPALAPPRGRRWHELTLEEQDAHDRKMAELRAMLDDGAKAVAPPPEHRPARRYCVVERAWPASMRAAWLDGYHARAKGCFGTDAPTKLNRTDRFFWVEGNLVAAGLVTGDLALSEHQLRLVDELSGDANPFDEMPGRNLNRAAGARTRSDPRD